MVIRSHICQLKNDSKDALNRHIKNKHKGLKYECHECDGLCTGKQGVRRHVESVHNGLNFEFDKFNEGVGSLGSENLQEKH